MDLTHGSNGENMSFIDYGVSIDQFLKVLKSIQPISLSPDYIPASDGLPYAADEKEFLDKLSLILIPESMDVLAPWIAVGMQRTVGAIRHQIENRHGNKGEWFFKNT
ncbi:hypothetical protein FAY30_23545 [Bacillus sp. S3]|uniref:hypothetical protein n=1 Tax=Bacillus sp. S3 TaxID=486398 RepID=UPI001188B56C|nr:hypothetical protein [Bacillus sp. S3]QCJ44621.1 hypothetical protein FAY30_23545 [Bacillus sp. S3]